MSGPFGVRITVISGKKLSGEIVVAAATLLQMGFLYIDLVAADTTIRQECLTTLKIFCNRKRIDCRNKPEEYARRVIQASKTISAGDLFWLALDKEGESLAKDIFKANGEHPGKRVYHSVNQLNLIEPTIEPLPQIASSTATQKNFWQKVFPPRTHPKPKPVQTYQPYMNRLAPLTPQQSLHYAWCEMLHEALIPWQDTIRNIQSDFS
jgi:hypothetical protein